MMYLVRLRCYYHCCWFECWTWDEMSQHIRTRHRRAQ